MGTLILLISTVSGCASAVSDSALCGGTERARTAHAAALAKDGGPLSLATGRALIATLDAGCGEAGE